MFIDSCAVWQRVTAHQAAIHRQTLALYQSDRLTLSHDLLKRLLEQLRLLKPSVSVLGERRVLRDLLVAPHPVNHRHTKMRAQLFHKFALAGDAIQIADQHDAQP
jgi:hypothetical protein